MVSYPSSSLEDCLTNVVSWTEFTGINWISLTSPNPVENANNCPILKAYNECQRLRIYSFWRRRPTQGVINKNAPKSPIITGKEPKELWIFWYENSEPPIVKELLENGLVQDQSGSFASNGLDYKIRILLYDALHRILESGCISKRFVRFGRWFCQPLTELITTRKKILPRYMIAFQFTFCTFGNQVCISPRFQRQPTLLSITKKHLLQKIRQKVILAPWGIVGYILPEQSHFDLDKSDPAESENEKPTEEKTNLLSSFGGLYSTPEKDKTATKKQLEEILKKYYDDFLFSVGYPELPSMPSDLPNVLAVEIDGISTFWPTALVAICIDDLKDVKELEEEDEGSEIEFIDPPSNSPSSYYAGCRAAQRIFEDALLPPPDRHDERLSLMDCTQKELCCCKSCNIPEAPFDALPSISPAGILNPNTPHSVQTKISEPPSVPPTSIESVHSTSGDLKHLRRPPRLRYKQPQFSFQVDCQKNRPKSPKIEAEVEEARRNDFAPTTSWAHINITGEYPINHMGVNGGYTVALADPIWNVLPIFRGDQEWDDTQAIPRPASPYTPITVVTPEYSQYNTDDEIMAIEPDFPRRDKPFGVSSTVREEEPVEPVPQGGEHSILRSLLDSTDESSPTTPASDGRKSQASSSSDESESPLNRRQWRNRKRGNLGVTVDFVYDEFKRRRIYMANLPMSDIGRTGVPKMTEYFEPGEVEWPDYIDDDDYYYPPEEENGGEYSSDFDDDEDEDEEDEYNYRHHHHHQMNEHEIERYAAPIERVPNPMASEHHSQRGYGHLQGQDSIGYDELESFVAQPSTFDEAMMLDSSDLMEVDNANDPSTSAQDPNSTVEGTKTLDEALREAIKPIIEIPEDEEIAESTKRAMEAFQKRNPFPLNKKDKRKQKLEEEQLLRDLISPDPEPIRQISRRTLSKVYHKIHRKLDPMYEMIDNIHDALPNFNIYKYEGCAPMIQCKEFYGDPFRDNVRIQPNMFETIDDRNARVVQNPIPPPPEYVKKTNVKNVKTVQKLNLQKVEEREQHFRYTLMQAQNYQNQQNMQQYHHQQQLQQQQQQHRHAMFMNQRHQSFMSNNSPQPNGMNPMFGNSIPPSTPSPMSTPRYMQPHSNTITVCGSNTGGSVQMADMGIGMNGFPGMVGVNNQPPMTSTPNSMMPYGPSPQMMSNSSNNSHSFMPPPPPYNPMMSNGYNQPTPNRMPSADNLLLNPFEPLPIATPDLTGLQMFEKIQKSVGFIFVALLRDSILDLHYDAVYDSCPLCSCTESIRTNEFGFYLSIPPDVQMADKVLADERHAEITVTTRFGGYFVKNRDIESCFCAFSAVRHRILCYANSNLFTDDIREATGGPVVVEVDKPELKWFNPLKSNDWKFIDVFRWYLLGHDLSAYIRTGYYIGDCPVLDKIEEFDRLVSPKKEYSINGIDQGELDYIVSSVLDASSLGQQVMAERTSRKPLQPGEKPDLTSLVHPWAVQLAEKTSQLNEIEYGGFMPKVFGILEETAQLVRAPTNPGSIVEGPLTWKSLHQKATKMYKIQKPDTEEDTSHNPEPIPNIVVGSEKDLILTSPTAIWAWDRYGLAPYSWPKNVLYLAVIPDHSFATEKTKSFAENSLIAEKCKIFLEDLSSVYEKNRLGRHLPLPPKVKDTSMPLNNGIIKIPLQNLNNSNDQKSLVQKLEYFVTQYLQLITRIFGEMDCFDKRTFLEAVYRDFYADHHSSAVPTDSSAMPPPSTVPPSQQQQQPISTSSPMPPNDASFDSPLFNHQQQTPQSLQQQQQNMNSPLPNMGLFDGGNILNPQTPDQSIPGLNLFGSDDPLSSTSISNGVDELMINDEENPALPHVLVIYIVNPFFFGSANTQEYFSKLVTVKLLKSFNNILSNLDHIKKPRVQVELIDIRTIFDYSAYSNDPLQEYFHPLNQSTVNDPMASINALRKLSFTVYSQPRQLHVEGIRDLLSKSMTRFGPFSQATDILDNLSGNPSSTYRIPTAPFILAPKSSNYEITPQGKLKLKNPDEKVLFVTYCLVKDDFLIVSVTDDRGELNDTKVISISRRTNQKSAQKGISSQVSLVVDAIQRLWAYIQGVMSLDTKNWRLVIGRFGKIGHGEFKAWTSILAKKNLQSYNSILKGKDKELQTPAAEKPSVLTASTSCKTCSLNPGFIETPALIAACLVSTESDAYFKIFPELLADPKQRGNRIIPNDYSITHIMVFPTSPCISNEVDAGLFEDNQDDLFFSNGPDDNNAGMEMDLEIDINDLGEVSSATTTIANQPIAMGFMVSTAPALDVPDWFWSQCPNAKNDTPVHLRSALHISVPHVQQNDDVMLAVAENHPLESNKTEEVLTYILQTYNELSWLNIDIISGQRKSCLPIHIQKLLVLYNSMNTTLY